jgi:hypothetical protein
MLYIYTLKHEDRVVYVGITKNPNDRKRQHKNTKPLPHTFNIVEEVIDIQTATEKEMFLIQKYNTISDGWNISPGGDYATNSGYKREGIGGVKKGTTPWNKGKSGCFSENTIKQMKETRKGRVFNSKLNEQKVKEIRERFRTHPKISGVGEIQPNGLAMTQERAFSNKYHEEYDITNVCLYNIVIGKTWSKIK